jgi:hypothetical protein
MGLIILTTFTYVATEARYFFKKRFLLNADHTGRPPNSSSRLFELSTPWRDRRAEPLEVKKESVLTAGIVIPRAGHAYHMSPW